MAAREAVADAGIAFDDESQRAAVIIGSGIGGMDTVTREVRTSPSAGLAGQPLSSP